jgi:hypothetical protein
MTGQDKADAALIIRSLMSDLGISRHLTRTNNGPWIDSSVVLAKLENNGSYAAAKAAVQGRGR